MLLDLSLTFALRLLIPLAAILPPSWLYALARGVGTAMLPILERRRLRVRANMQRLQPRWSPEQLDRAVTQQFQETAAYYVDLALLPRRTPEWIFQRRLLCEGLEHLDAAVAAGRGVVLAGLHLSKPGGAVSDAGRPQPGGDHHRATPAEPPPPAPASSGCVRHGGCASSRPTSTASATRWKR